MSRVYFARAVGFSPVKIGWSWNPRSRVRSGFNHVLHRDCELLAMLPGGAELERRFHVRFLDDWLGGEWFRASAGLDDTILAIKADTFDPDSLPPVRSIPRSLLWMGPPAELFGPIRKGAGRSSATPSQAEAA